MDGEPCPLPRPTIAAYCRGDHPSCAAFRFVRATGRPAHVADFRAWVLRGIPPGHVEPAPNAPSRDGA